MSSHLGRALARCHTLRGGLVSIASVTAFLALVPIHWTLTGQSSFDQRDNAGRLALPTTTGAGAVDTRVAQPTRPAAPSAESRGARPSETGSKPRAGQAPAQTGAGKNPAAKTPVAGAWPAKTRPSKVQAARAHAGQKTQGHAALASKAAVTPQAKSPSPPSKSPAVPEPTTVAITPISGGGYVFPGGRMRIGADGRSVESVHFSSGCAAGRATPPLALDAHGVFRYTGPLNGVIEVALVGRFVDRGHASLQIRLTGARCPAELVVSTARLS